MKPNPGSDAAVKAGCTCPVMDNAHGRGYMGGVKDKETGETLFVYTVGCKIHDSSTNIGYPGENAAFDPALTVEI